ncbi:2Fe-2S iron-sulfur cluster binding domain-containing protein [Muricauda sp. JGD-17]|uniref:2Fe-2S iron-sulfur cluster binding domain-containing protein n=1 Tax=Flagellimonas ochracea TaxID=2696472 RepID=A0A964WY64_9FLAO|nr:(2Fe-2S)-binding protein [Allomuricauda ochracea]NAY92587.1 2Fe-2S iron-sulfur cluster binding domain-containing protein [Allomuricauda ochracea]
MASFTLTVNNKKRTFSAEPDTPLLWVLRDILGLTGTKYACGKGICGSCTVIVNGKSVRSCAMAIQYIGKDEVLTIEGLSEGADHPIQKAWIAADVPQCGYCQPGFIMSTFDLLSNNPEPSDEEINQALQGNICRCGTYTRIRKAIQIAITETEN